VSGSRNRREPLAPGSGNRRLALSSFEPESGSRNRSEPRVRASVETEDPLKGVPVPSPSDNGRRSHEVNANPHRAGQVRRPWTSAELEALRILGPVLGGTGCAKAFERSHSAIKQKASELGVSLRRSRSHQTDFRPSCGPVVLRRIRELTEAELCPACGKRLIGVKRTGLCGRCHFKGLVTVHEEEIDRLEGHRELWAARSKLRRRRRELGRLDGPPAASKQDDWPLE